MAGTVQIKALLPKFEVAKTLCLRSGVVGLTVFLWSTTHVPQMQIGRTDAKRAKEFHKQFFRELAPLEWSDSYQHHPIVAEKLREKFSKTFCSAALSICLVASTPVGRLGFTFGF